MFWLTYFLSAPIVRRRMLQMKLDTLRMREATERNDACNDLLIDNLERLKRWCQFQAQQHDPGATIWLHIDEAIRALSPTEEKL